MPPVAVLIPGIMGSELKLGDEVVWPGPIKSLVFAYTKMDQLLSPETTWVFGMYWHKPRAI